MTETALAALRPAPRDPPSAVLAPGAPGCPKLTEALAQARDRCKAAAKDGNNTFHHYRYATADNVIATANEALAGSGLALLPASQSMGILGSGGMAIFTLDRVLVLSHSSGEYLPLEIRGWPVIPDKGRPADKAFASALTSSLAYLLRDLLQMPRGTDNDMDGRDDRQSPPAGFVAANGQHAAPAEPDPQAEAPARAEAAREVRYGGPDHAQVDRIAALVNGKRLDWARFAVRLKEKYGVESVAHLSRGQADEVERALLAPQPAAAPG